MITGKRVLVTGGAGFIGSHLCESLVPDNTVVSIDNYSTGCETNHISEVTYLKGETSEIDTLVSGDFDIVFHLGEYSRVEQSFDEIQKVWESNKLGTFAVLEFCRAHSVRLVYAGSSTKFGDGGLGRSQSPYGWTKASNTELVINYGNWFSLDYAITYFYNVYGPREIAAGKYATLIGLFSLKMRLGEPLAVVSPGTQRRNFTHVKDVVDALHLIGESGRGDEFGIGHPESFSVQEVADLFGGPVISLPARRGNRLSADLVVDKTRLLGWAPKHDLRTYIGNLREKRWDPDYEN